jgi:hypothetical protein
MLLTSIAPTPHWRLTDVREIGQKYSRDPTPGQQGRTPTRASCRSTLGPRSCSLNCRGQAPVGLCNPVPHPGGVTAQVRPSRRNPRCRFTRLGGGLALRASAARRFAADSEQWRAASRAVALPAGPTVRQGDLARVGDGDLLAADAPALWAWVLFLVGVRLNHVPQAYFGATCLLCRAPHRWAATSRDRRRRNDPRKQTSIRNSACRW